MNARIGLITYANDPANTLVRVVYLADNDPDRELDNPRWAVEGMDTSQPLKLHKVGTGTPVKGRFPLDVQFTVSNDEEGPNFVTVSVNDIALIPPGSRSWRTPQPLIDAMARLRAKQQGGG
jgi:hypothetical protein